MKLCCAYAQVISMALIFKRDLFKAALMNRFRFVFTVIFFFFADK